MHSNPFEDQNPFEHPRNSFDKPEEAIFTQPWLKVNSGRPNLEHMLSEEINAASGKVSVSGGFSGFGMLLGLITISLFLKVCGPNALAKVVRKALRIPWSSPSSPLNGGPSVTLHVACFGYA
jgi:ferric-chelate reductase